MISEFRQSFISGESHLIEPRDLTGQFDVFIAASSWDLRSVCVTQAPQLCMEHAILMLFETRDTKGLRDRHDDMLRNYCASRSRQVHTLLGRSVEVEEMWEKLRVKLIDMGTACGRSLRVFLDISTCPRYYFGAICAFVLKSGLATSLSVFYAE